MMRIVDGLLAMPFLIIVILFREIITPYIDTLAKFLIDDWGWNDNTVLRFANLIPLTIAIAGFGWLSMGRIVRSAAASLSKQEFVEAAPLPWNQPSPDSLPTHSSQHAGPHNNLRHPNHSQLYSLRGDFKLHRPWN